MKKTLDIAYFNQFTKGYSPYCTQDIEKLTRSPVQLLRKKRNITVAEIGCGSGQISQEICNKLYGSHIEFYGVDIADIILKHYPFNKIHASAFNLPFKPDSFDMICYPASLHHLYPFDKALIEMDRILKNEGYFYCIEPNLFHPHRFLFVNFSKLYKFIRKIDDVPINPYKLIKKLKNKGYSIVECSFINIAFKKPGLLQKIQNKIATSVWGKLIPVFTMPWFIILAKKK